MRLLRFEHEGTAHYGVLIEGFVNEIEGTPFDGFATNGGEGSSELSYTGESFPLAHVRLLAPVAPSKVVCVGLNYTDHAEELGLEPPSEPVMFVKPPSAVCGPDDPILYPPQSRRVDYEAELAIVIGRRCRDVEVDEASSYILGYTIANDVTARDLQMKDGQWTRAKSFDSFCPLGPWIETNADPTSLSIKLWVDDQLMQSSSTARMHFSVEQIVSHISQIMTLEPGDVILTGTPPGVGSVHPGNRIRVEIESIGCLENPVERRS